MDKNTRYFGFYFTSNADGSANDHTLYGQMSNHANTIKLGARYKNSEPSHLYEIELDAKDLRLLAKQLLATANMLEMEADNA